MTTLCFEAHGSQKIPCRHRRPPHPHPQTRPSLRHSFNRVVSSQEEQQQQQQQLLSRYSGSLLAPTSQPASQVRPWPSSKRAHC
jgi:hypothetical protein